MQHRLGADEQQRAVGARQRLGSSAHRPPPRSGRRRQRRGSARLAGAIEGAVEVAGEIPALEPLGERRRFLPRLRGPRRDTVPFARGRLRIEQIDRALEEDRPRNALTRHRESGLEQRRQLAHSPRAPLPLHVRRHERLLIDVLQRTASLEHGGRRAAEEDHRRLRHLGVLDRRDRVGEARTGGDRGDPRNPGEARHRVGREDRVDFVAGVDDADAERLRSHQDRRDMSTAEREQRLHPLPLKHLRDAITAMAHGCEDSHSAPPTATRARQRAKPTPCASGAGVRVRTPGDTVGEKKRTSK